ncbi:unnamed protein product [Rotaria sp. Silwood1]|nr:unnamed protein product [Rotaria sp. Silwood1]
MLCTWCFRWLLLTFIFVTFNAKCTTATWPILDLSTIQLLELFEDEPNTSKPTESSLNCRAMFKAANGYPIGDISSAYSIMSNFNIIGMVGPTYSREAHIIAQYADSIDIPAIRYSATDPELSDRNAYPAF